MENEKRHIYVSAEFADKYERLSTVEAQAEIAKEICKAKRLDIQSELDILDDDLLRFKSACVIHKSEMKKAYDEQAVILDKLVSDCWDSMPKAKANAEKMAAEIHPLSNAVSDLNGQVSSLKKEIDNLNIYGADKLLDLVQKISCMDSSSKDMLSFLCENFKRGSE